MFGLLCLLKTYDLYVRLPRVLDSTDAAIIVVVWAVSALAVTIGGIITRPALMSLIASGAATFLYTGLRIYNHHMSLLLLVAAIFLLFRRDEQRLLLKVQLSIVYAFAALTKMNASWISGASLELNMLRRPLARSLGLNSIDPDVLLLTLPAVAVAVVAIEAWLAVGLWWERTRGWTAAVGVLFHAAMVPLMAANAVQTVRLVVFSGATMMLYLSFFGDRGARVKRRKARGRSVPRGTPRPTRGA